MLIILVLLLVCVKNTNKYKAIKSLQCLHFERGLKKNEEVGLHPPQYRTSNAHGRWPLGQWFAPAFHNSPSQRL